VAAISACPYTGADCTTTRDCSKNLFSTGHLGAPAEKKQYRYAKRYPSLFHLVILRLLKVSLFLFQNSGARQEFSLTLKKPCFEQ
jgi:hypothetical protein